MCAWMLSPRMDSVMRIPPRRDPLRQSLTPNGSRAPGDAPPRFTAGSQLYLRFAVSVPGYMSVHSVRDAPVAIKWPLAEVSNPQHSSALLMRSPLSRDNSHCDVSL